MANDTERVRCEGCYTLIGPGHIEPGPTPVECTVGTLSFPDVLCPHCKNAYRKLLLGNEHKGVDFVPCQRCATTLARVTPVYLSLIHI